MALPQPSADERRECPAAPFAGPRETGFVTVMTSLLLVLAVIALALHLMRHYVAHVRRPKVLDLPFDGRRYRAGANEIAVRRSPGATRTFVCVPGFLEDARFFLDLHEGSQADLILFGNGNYHSPFAGDDAEELDWDLNPHRVGTIAYDAFHVARAVEHLAKTRIVILHGHSRGGAVVLDAARQFSDRMRTPDRDVRALLEAPVLPHGKQAGTDPGPVGRAIVAYLLPLFLAVSRNISKTRLERFPMMRPTNPHKTEVLRSLFQSTRDYDTCVENVADIAEWEETQGYGLFDNYERITIVVGERDDVLDNRALVASAEEGAARNAGIRIVRTEDTNHFVSLETPEVIQRELEDLAS